MSPLPVHAVCHGAYQIVRVDSLDLRSDRRIISTTCLDRERPHHWASLTVGGRRVEPSSGDEGLHDTPTVANANRSIIGDAAGLSHLGAAFSLSIIEKHQLRRTGNGDLFNFLGLGGVRVDPHGRHVARFSLPAL
jgi:hypothetical protein